MFRKSVASLYLNKSKIQIKDPCGVDIDFTSVVSDHATPYYSSEECSPDFYINGFYRSINKDSLIHFIMAPKGEKGTHKLLITGIPLNSNIEFYRFKNTNFTSYWEDSMKGCLFQILPEKPVYIGLTKKAGILQIHV